jgi:glyoxylase-like metal-dependent hydrolase (beta-lactamase superfamily II)
VVELPVRRIDFGYFVRPAEETGTGLPKVEPCLGYVILHPHGVVLVDTGMGSHPDVDSHYRPRRRPLAEAFALRVNRSPCSERERQIMWLASSSAAVRRHGPASTRPGSNPT